MHTWSTTNSLKVSTNVGVFILILWPSPKFPQLFIPNVNNFPSLDIAAEDLFLADITLNSRFSTPTHYCKLQEESCSTPVLPSSYNPTLNNLTLLLGSSIKIRK